jgi:hypothetical protein
MIRVTLRTNAEGGLEVDRLHFLTDGVMRSC